MTNDEKLATVTGKKWSDCHF